MYTSGASNFSESVDWVFKFIISISVFFVLLISATMVYFLIRYNRKRHPKAYQIKDSTTLEITWITIPLILVIMMFYYGFSAFEPMIWVPKDAMNVKVTGRMWSWSFLYPGNKETDILVLPINKAVRLDLHSEDVIHGFSVPAFRVKEDVVPGKKNYMWFRPQQLGDFSIFCTAYCGVRHSYMGTKVRIVSEGEFTRWLTTLPVKPLEPAGLTIIKKNACTGCHSLDGTKLVSTSFKGLFGKVRHVSVEGGPEQTVTADEAYIKMSIYEPDRMIVTGYSKGIMKSYKGILKDDQVALIIEYFKTLR